MSNHQVDAKTETATLGGGCFWCLEAVYRDLRGVEHVVPGYAGGAVVAPSYEQVCAGTTGHAEVVQVTFDPSIVSFRNLLEVFFSIHDPTTLNRQGHDVGTQYRSVIFYHDEEQQATAQTVIKEIAAAEIWGAPLVTELVPFSAFFPAEEYHYDYYSRNPKQPYCQAVIEPKVVKFRQRFLDQLKR